MNKILQSLVVLLLLSINANALEELSKKAISDIENLEIFKRVGITINKAYETKSLYMLNVNIQGQKNDIFLTKDKNNLIVGEVINTSNGTKLLIPIDISILKDKQAFTFGTGKDEYYLFTDPQCPYCKQFEEHFPKIANKVKIRVFYFPLSFHAQAKDISLYIMSQKTEAKKIKAMLNITEESKEFKNRKYVKGELEKLQKHLDEQVALGTKIGVSGTPTIFDKDGNKVVWAQMLQDYGVKLK